MDDFRNAFKSGQAGVEKAVMARKEISSILEEFGADVKAMTGGKVAIGIRLLTETVDPNASGILAAMSKGIFSQTGPRTYWAIAAWNVKVGESSRQELAKWRRHRSGYPCAITWNNAERECTDRVSLIKCLVDLLRDLGVSEKLKTLMALQPKTNATPPQKSKPSQSSSSSPKAIAAKPAQSSQQKGKVVNPK